jgi:sulfate permease
MLTFAIIPFLLAMFLAITMGGSGTAPAFASAYGSNLIKKHQITLLFGVMVMLGAIFSGHQVSITLGQGLLEQEFFTLKITSAILFSVSLSLLVANLLGIPQSTSQATVMAISGAATYLQGLNVQRLFFEIIPMWFVLPLVSFGVVWLVGWLLMPTIQRLTHLESYQQATAEHPFFRYLVVASCLYVSYSLGANNVGNAAGPITSMAIRELGVRGDTATNSFQVVMMLSILIVAPCFAIGSELMGYRGLRNTGKEIVQIGPLGGTLISVVTATLLLYASIQKGIPTSLVQLNSVAFMAHSVNLVGWRSTFSNPKVKRFFVVWGIAPVFSFFFALFLTWLLSKI